MKQFYTVTEYADMLAPDWLAARINYTSIKFVYYLSDGVEKLKGVRINGQIAEIGDKISFDGKRLSVEKNHFSECNEIIFLKGKVSIWIKDRWRLETQ